ncbi:MAG: hypothetical protein CVU57_12365 [Deltaproteobacteria bacterium HGW-Deltaproteobacteria-15]|nr:MAG: hypothetical protein CVU57_12365 [Deltaproteobacteria bacterium HGW-Deltaproteobacteria-15]
MRGILLKTQAHLIGSLVLVHYQDRPTVYARIEAIEPDVKKDWYQVTLLLLSIPAKDITWILREEYILGSPFTMGGQSMKLEPIPSHTPPAVKVQDTPKEDGTGKSGKVVPFKKGRS